MSVQGAVHSLHDDCYGLSFVLAIHKAFAYAIIEGVGAIALQRGIREISPGARNFAGTKCGAFHDFASFNMPRRKVYAPAQREFVRKPT